MAKRKSNRAARRLFEKEPKEITWRDRFNARTKEKWIAHLKLRAEAQEKAL